MSTHLSAQTGPYLHSPADKWTKVFKQPGGTGTRSFTILIAAAHDADVVGPERNGVVVLDADNMEVVVDQMLRNASGHDGPSPDQRALAAKMMDAKWGEFVGILAGHPRFRDTLESGPVQWVQSAAEDGDRALIGAARRAEQLDGGVELPAVQRRDILREILAHAVHRERGGPALLAWTVKAHDVDSSGRGWERLQVDPKYDAAWSAYKRAAPSLFSLLCEDALIPYLEGKYATYPGDDLGHYQFATQGRRGGWLVLGAVKGIAAGPTLEFESRADMAQKLAGLDDAALAGLYVVIRNLDRDLSPKAIDAEMAFRYASLRNSLEADGSLDEYLQSPNELP